MFYLSVLIVEIWEGSSFKNLIDEAPPSSFGEQLMWLAGKVWNEEIGVSYVVFL